MHEATIMARKQNVTFADIAKYTNFSKTTISRYFNNPDSLTEKNQKIIADALEKLNYQENKVARILASGQTEFVGVIIPNLFLHYYSEMLDRILSTYETFGYKFLVFLSNGDADTERQYIQELLAYKIEADHFKPCDPFDGTCQPAYPDRSDRAGGCSHQQHQHR